MVWNIVYGAVCFSLALNGCSDWFGFTGFLEKENKHDSVHTCTRIT